MNRFIFIFFLIILTCRAFPQFYGGNEDGSSLTETGLIQINSQDLYCSGGMNDGFYSVEIITSLNDPENYCSGGNGDGFSRITAAIQPINDQGLYCSGGNEDGFKGLRYSGHLFNSVYCYAGGIEDGFSLLSSGYVPLFDQEFYLAGGSGDGSADLIHGPVPLNIQVFYASGGFDDGFNELYSGYTSVCNSFMHANGGPGDGFHRLTYTGPIFYSTAWKGGAGDGYTFAEMSFSPISPAVYCFGGQADGADMLHMMPTWFGSGIWLGVMSSAWEDPVNWSGNLVPDITVNAVIPAGRPRYPYIQSGPLTVNNIQGTHLCRSLTIQEGASVINKSDLYLFGEMTVSGLYQADDHVNNHIYIYQGGNLRILAPGQVIAGPP